MKPPAFQFYADDFLGGTMTMDHAERGFYILLLALQWTQGGISKQDFIRLGKGMAQPSLNHVRSKFKEGEDGLLRNQRMELERQKQADFRANRSESGKSGAAKRWHSHGSAITQPMANGMAKHSSPSPSPSPASGSGETRARELPTEEEAIASTMTERYQALRNANQRYTPLQALQSVTGDHSASASASVTASEGVQGEILTEAEAVASVMTAGIPEAFSRYVYADWSTRAGKDAGGVLVSFCPYCTKRWAREQVEWKAKTHKGTKVPTNRNGNAVKPQKSLLQKIIDEI